MLQYLVIQLDDTSTSYCHYTNPKEGRHLMSLETLKRGILFGMTENFNIQIVYPPYTIPDEYNQAIDSINCVRIKPAKECANANAVVFNNLDEVDNLTLKEGVYYILRIDKKTLFDRYDKVSLLLEDVRRLNIVITDIESFNKDDFTRYENVLKHLNEKIKELFTKAKFGETKKGYCSIQQ